MKKKFSLRQRIGFAICALLGRYDRIIAECASNAVARELKSYVKDKEEFDSRLSAFYAVIRGVSPFILVWKDRYDGNCYTSYHCTEEEFEELRNMDITR